MPASIILEEHVQNSRHRRTSLMSSVAIIAAAGRTLLPTQHEEVIAYEKVRSSKFRDHWIPKSQSRWDIIKTKQGKAIRNRRLTDNKLLSSSIRGAALLWLSHSRSNPDATPLANII
jgi:hypothetical protein